MPRVSVILPNYNYARYLRERARSIVEQTFSDFEFLYLDDASTDESNTVMKEFAADPRLHQRCFTENSGKVYQRWNDGAALARGDWLWFAGADDTAHPRFLERLLATADAHPEVGLVHCRMMTIDDLGRVVDKCRAFPRDEVTRLSADYFASGFEETVRMARSNTINCASGLLIRREAFEDAGGFDTRLWLTADWDLYVSVLQKYNVAYTAEPLVCYRAHRKTVTNTTKRAVAALEILYCLARAFSAASANAACTDKQRAVMRRGIKVGLFDLLEAPHLTLPSHLRFAAEAVFQVVPDKRLLQAVR